MLLLSGAMLLPACDGATNSQAPAAQVPAAKAVRIAQVEMRTLPRSILATGTLLAREESTLSTNVAGRLQAIAVDVGSEVRAGEVLAQLDPRDYELRIAQSAAALAEARAALGIPAEGVDDEPPLEELSGVRQSRVVLDDAARNHKRLNSLSHKGVISTAELDVADATLRVAQARYETVLEEARTRIARVAQRRVELEIARKQLADTSVRAPFDGAVLGRARSPGEYVAAGAPILTLVQLDPLRLQLQIPERSAAKLRVGQAVYLQVEGVAGEQEGRIARIAPALDVASRLLSVEADVPRAAHIRPGHFARARIVVAEEDRALCAPAAALSTFAGIEKLLVIDPEMRLQEKRVTTGEHAGDWIEILDGVSEGDRVVLDPGVLRTGQPVTIEQ